ncbi:MAG TPA: hypothetical protein VJP45_02420 [Candidatus Limnocylindria bacterium]|nr:hypothetical protein [Candidatus Limnocylindria bacterium]
MDATNSQREDGAPPTLIRYLCVRRRHLGTNTHDTVTIHNGEWAFCHGTVQRDHKWVATGGLTLEELRRSSLARELSVP